MRTWAWLVPAALGLALMLQSYDRLLKGDPDAPWASGFLCIGEGGAARPWELGSRLSARLRYLPASELVQAMLKGLGATKPETKGCTGCPASLQARRASGGCDAFAGG